MLQVNDLSKSFGGLRAVSGVTFHAGEATIHSIIGPNGAGKTTLFNLITGAFKPQTGTVRFGGMDITGWAPERLAKLGVVRTFQRTSVFKKLSAIENVALAIRTRENFGRSIWHSQRREQRVLDEAAGVLETVGLRNREHDITGQLAHGLQRALDIAFGLALKPRLILMDEPLAGMSRGDRETVAALVLKLRDLLKLTVIVVEHDVGMVMRLSDRITVMQQGQVIAEGVPGEIRDNEAVRNAYLKGEFAS
jgi:branched-chain amino acid transport system ATP-binding protein